MTKDQATPSWKLTIGKTPVNAGYKLISLSGHLVGYIHRKQELTKIIKAVNEYENNQITICQVNLKCHELLMRAEVYKNAEERFRQEIISRNETIESQNKELNNLKAIKEELLNALKTVVNRCDELTTMNFCRSNGISDFIIEHAKGTIERAEQ